MYKWRGRRGVVTVLRIRFHFEKIRFISFAFIFPRMHVLPCWFIVMSTIAITYTYNTVIYYFFYFFYLISVEITKPY